MKNCDVPIEGRRNVRLSYMRKYISVSETDIVGINDVNRKRGGLPFIEVKSWLTLTESVCFDRNEVGTTTACVQIVFGCRWN